MSLINLTLPVRTVRIAVQAGLLDYIPEWVGQIETPPVVLLCSDTTVADLWGKPLLHGLEAAGWTVHQHVFPPGDDSKCLAQLDAIYRTLGRIHLARDGLLVALGGGVVSDMTGFAAATWMRGVRYLTCPTTLEADVDAAIGGKTGINHAAGKNMVGAFHHPEMVLIDPLTLTTLPARDVSAGLAESVKHALIQDSAFLTWHEDHADAILAVEPQVMTELIERNVRIKCAVVEADEREQGLRAILNFGHTIGHAVEKWFGYRLRHGEAVALGMVAAARMSAELGMLAPGAVQRIVMLLDRLKLPTAAPQDFDVDEVVGITSGDKKVRAARRRWVLLSDVGRAVIRDDVPAEMIRAAVVGLLPG